MDQTDETLSTHPKLINKENSRNSSFHTKQMIKVNELTTGGKTSNLAKHLSLAHPDLFRELKDRQVSKCIIHKFRLNFNFYSQLLFSSLSHSTEAVTFFTPRPRPYFPSLPALLSRLVILERLSLHCSPKLGKNHGFDQLVSQRN